MKFYSLDAIRAREPWASAPYASRCQGLPRQAGVYPIIGASIRGQLHNAQSSTYSPCPD